MHFKYHLLSFRYCENIYMVILDFADIRSALIFILRNIAKFRKILLSVVFIYFVWLGVLSQKGSTLFLYLLGQIVTWNYNHIPLDLK